MNNFSLFVCLLTQSSGVMWSIPVYCFVLCLMTPTLLFCGTSQCYLVCSSYTGFHEQAQYVKKKQNKIDMILKTKHSKWWMDWSKVWLNVRTLFILLQSRCVYFTDGTRNIRGLCRPSTILQFPHEQTEMLYFHQAAHCFHWQKADFSRRHLVTSSAPIFFGEKRIKNFKKFPEASEMITSKWFKERD